jgi:hypothetical protein
MKKGKQMKKERKKYKQTDRQMDEKRKTER